MSDTPDTDAAWADWTYAGPGVHANFARKLERERDMLKIILEERTDIANSTEDRMRAIICELESASADGDYCRVNKIYWFALITERDELRAELERLKAERDNDKLTRDAGAQDL